jgi:hypothetical protein
MLRKHLLIALSMLFVCSLPLHAQEPPDDPKENAEDEEDPKKDKKEEKPDEPAGAARFWQAKLGDGHYIVALDHITSVSRHKYLLDGALIVDEVTVDSMGQALARFYHITPVTDAMPGNTAAQITKRSTELIEKVAERAGSDLPNMVVKKYPETTHARTIEYRILSETELTALFKSVQKAWESGQGRVFSGK